jgi:hypothetical protein
MKTRFALILPVALGLAGSIRAEDAGSDAAAGPRAEVALPVNSHAAPAECVGWCNACGVGKERFWVSGDYLLAWVHGTGLPPLVTTSPTGTAQAAAGVLGNPSTSILFGDTRVNEDERSGGRFGLGYWFNAEHTHGIEAGTMVLESQATIFTASSTGTPILARPFFNASTNQQDSLLVAFPGSSSGSIAIRAASGNLYEAHIDLTENIVTCGCFRLDSLLGYRFYRYDEGLHIQELMMPTNPLFASGTQITSIDSFTTSNTFHGGDLGLRWLYTWNNLCLGVRTSLAVGGVDRVIKISGSQTTTVPNVAPVVQTGGLFALSTNIGTYHRDDWTVIPEFTFDLSWKLRENLSVRLGYTLFGLDRFARAADQLDFKVNSNFLPPVGAAPAGPARPAFLLKRDDVWVQALSLGVELAF